MSTGNAGNRVRMKSRVAVVVLGRFSRACITRAFYPPIKISYQSRGGLGARPFARVVPLERMNILRPASAVPSPVLHNVDAGEATQTCVSPPTQARAAYRFFYSAERQTKHPASRRDDAPVHIDFLAARCLISSAAGEAPAGFQGALVRSRMQIAKSDTSRPGIFAQPPAYRGSECRRKEKRETRGSE
jgi:hypothetical protein